MNSLDSKNPNDNYLYYIIRDNEGAVRGHIIGAQHWVEEKDKKLNPLILDAIDHSARFILEQPPGSDLLPKEPQFFNDNLEYIVEDLQLPLSSEAFLPQTTHIQSRLEKIKEDLLEITNAYTKVEDIIQHIQSEEDKSKFLDEVEKTISESTFDLKLVSLEDNMNLIIQAKNKKIEALENFNLMDKIKEARARQQEREKKEEESSAFGKKKVTPVKIDLQAHKAELHEAWVKGDEIKLGKLVDKSFKLYEESPEIDEVHRPRDKDIADKIIEVMKQSYKDHTEATIMMGTAHLVYTVRTNVLKHLENAFSKELKDWSITQVKINL